MNEYKEVIETLLDGLYPTGELVEVEVCGGEFYCCIDIETLLEKNDTTDFYSLMTTETELIFDEVFSQTIIGTSASDIREITFAMAVHFYKELFNINVVSGNETSVAKLVEEVFGYPK